MNKPRLTKAMVEKLRKASQLIENDAMMMDDDPPHMREMNEAAEWLWKLCDWYDEKQVRKGKA